MNESKSPIERLMAFSAKTFAFIMLLPVYLIGAVVVIGESALCGFFVYGLMYFLAGLVLGLPADMRDTFTFHGSAAQLIGLFWGAAFFCGVLWGNIHPIFTRSKRTED